MELTTSAKMSILHLLFCIDSWVNRSSFMTKRESCWQRCRIEETQLQLVTLFDKVSLAFALKNRDSPMWDVQFWNQTTKWVFHEKLRTVTQLQNIPFSVLKWLLIEQKYLHAQEIIWKTQCYIQKTKIENFIHEFLYQSLMKIVL